jgi:hypothetical protein
LKNEAMAAVNASSSSSSLAPGSPQAIPTKLLPSAAYRENNNDNNNAVATSLVKKVSLPLTSTPASSNSAPNTPHRSSSAPKTHVANTSAASKTSNAPAATTVKTLPVRASTGGIALAANSKRSTTPTNVKMLSKSLPSPGLPVKPKPFPVPHNV